MPGQLRTGTPRPGPDRADEAGPADAARGRSGDERVPWSRADLQQRLERLPLGHPSSPVDDDISRRADRSDREPDAVKRDYWTEVPRFLRAWADHVRSWPGEREAVAVDRSRDPEGSWRGDGNQYLSPDQHAEAKDVIARVHQAEETLTKRMGDVERENPSGGWLAGLEFRLKGEDRLKEKIAEVSKRGPDRSVADIMRTLPDAIRYTFCLEAASYSEGYQDVKQRLEAHEYRMVYSKNHWRADQEYKGINTRWVTPDGQRFEIQFHTAESLHAKQQVTHKSYERLRNPMTGYDERQALRAFQRDVCSWLSTPDGATAISDYLPERP